MDSRLNARKEEGSFIQFVIFLVAACLVFAIMQGVRDNYGIMLNAVAAQSGVTYATVSTVIAVGQFLYGLTQPFFAAIALRKSNAFVMLCGIALMATGLIGTPFCSSSWTLLLFFGILLPSGTGALCFGMVMGALTPLIGERRAAIASGIVQSSAGIGDALMSPALEYLISWKGITTSMITLSTPILLMTPIVIWMGRCKKAQDAALPAPEQAAAQEKPRISDVLRTAFRDRTYICLLIGFSTCGFHMSIIETHLFSYYMSHGIPSNLSSYTFTVYGIFTMLGAMATGFLGLKFRMKNVLGSTYGIRVLIDLGFLLLPKSIPFSFVATALLGMTGDSTVPPTTGLITKKFGSANMALLYGIIFIGHQVGAFLSSWLGGVFVNFGLGYNALWIADLCLCALASTASYLIKD